MATSKKLFEEIKILNPIWKNIPTGSKVTGTIENKPFEGRICKEVGNIYLCQNHQDGDDCKNKLGYKYSWNIYRGSPGEIKDNGVVIHSIILDPKFKIEKPIQIGDYKVTFNKGNINVGCQTITNKQAREIVKKLID